MKLYHATKEDNVRSILEQGLLVGKSTGGVIYFVETIKAARAWEKGEVILEVDFPPDTIMLWSMLPSGTIEPRTADPGPPWQLKHPDGRLSPVHQQHSNGPIEWREDIHHRRIKRVDNEQGEQAD
jgi:hypothetical protein